MLWRLLDISFLGLVVIGSFGSANIVKNSTDKACQPVNYWVFNGHWVEKSEPRVWWYCQEPEKVGGDSGAPVYHNYRNEAAVIYGIYWGGTDTVSAYSPIDGIEEDLGIVLDVT